MTAVDTKRDFQSLMENNLSEKNRREMFILRILKAKVHTKKPSPSTKLIYSGGNRNDSVPISGGFESIHRKRWRLVHLPIILSV